MYMGSTPTEAREDIGSSEGRVRGGCEPLNTGAGRHPGPCRGTAHSAAKPPSQHQRFMFSLLCSLAVKFSVLVFVVVTHKVSHIPG